MRQVAYALAGASTLLLASAAIAQSATVQKDSVSDYLCQFAGKCAGETGGEATPTIAAPATKGFRLAAAQTTPSAQPTIAAPQTKGFRIASGTQAATPTVAAPPTKSFRIAKAQPAAVPVRAAVPMRVVAPARVAPASGTRANLLLAFEYNSAQMTPSAEAKAKGFAQALMMSELKDKRFLIEGHTDARGSRDANIDLSRRRAQSVADFLVSQGVDRGRVEVKGVGPDEPLPGHSASAEANRRVEAVLLS